MSVRTRRRSRRESGGRSFAQCWGRVATGSCSPGCGRLYVGASETSFDPAAIEVLPEAGARLEPPRLRHFKVCSIRPSSDVFALQAIAPALRYHSIVRLSFQERIKPRPIIGPI